MLAAELARSSDHITAFARYHDRLASFLRSSKMQRKGWAWRSRRRIGCSSRTEHSDEADGFSFVANFAMGKLPRCDRAARVRRCLN